MKTATQDWVDKAEADYHVAALSRRSRKRGSREIACYLLQQCVEKYLKARLIEAGINFPRTHDIRRLLDLAVTVEPLWITLAPALATITNYAVATRYPGGDVTSAEANALLAATTRIRAIVRQSLGLR